MKTKDYERFCEQSDLSAEYSDDMRLLHLLAGLSAEVGEVHELYQKHVRKHANTFVDKSKALDELSDVLWYVTRLINVHGSTLDDVMRHNMLKLQNRGYQNEDS